MVQKMALGTFALAVVGDVPVMDMQKLDEEVPGHPPRTLTRGTAPGNPHPAGGL